MKRSEVLKAIGKNNWKESLKYMEGQTLGINFDGSIDHYGHDVKKFLA